MLYSADERRCTEQIRLFLSETGLRFEERVVSEADTQQLTKEGKLMFGKVPALKIGDFWLSEGLCWMRCMDGRVKEGVALES